MKFDWSFPFLMAVLLLVAIVGYLADVFGDRSYSSQPPDGWVPVGTAGAAEQADGRFTYKQIGEIEKCRVFEMAYKPNWTSTFHWFVMDCPAGVIKL